MSGRIRAWFSRSTTAGEGGRRAPRRPCRNRRQPQIDGLGPRPLLSGNPSIRELPIPTPTGKPIGIAPGPGGNVGFAESGAGKIGRITPGGVVTEFSAGILRGGSPQGIAVGPDASAP
jgi:streptogramin lyase